MNPYNFELPGGKCAFCGANTDGRLDVSINGKVYTCCVKCIQKPKELEEKAERIERDKKEFKS